MDSVNKYGSDGVPFTGEIAEIMPEEQQFQKINDAWNQFCTDAAKILKPCIDSLVLAFQSVIDGIVPLIGHCINVTTHLWEEMLKTYPDKRVVWLAFHHKKAKVRKKNMARIKKYMEKAVKIDDHG